MHPGLHFQTSCILYVIYIDPSRTFLRFIVRHNYLRDRSNVKPSISAADINVTFAYDNAPRCTAHILLRLPTYAWIHVCTRVTGIGAWYRACALSSRDRLIDSLMHPGNPVFLSLSLKATALPRKYAPMSITPWYRQSDSTLIKNGRDRRQPGESSRRDCPRVSWKRTCLTI